MKFLSKIMEIKSKSGELHFERWAILDCRWFGLYVHRIHKADKDLHLHSHPWNFLGIILKGEYLEEIESKKLYGQECQDTLRHKTRFSISVANKNFFHKIKSMGNEPVYSLFFVYGKSKDWYYKVDGKNIHFKEYREKKTKGEFKCQN